MQTQTQMPMRIHTQSVKKQREREEKLRTQWAELTTCGDNVGHFFRSIAKLETQLARNFKMASKTIVRALIHIEGQPKSRLSGTIGFEQVKDPQSECEYVVANWTLLANAMLHTSKLHDDIAQFVNKVGVTCNSAREYGDKSRSSTRKVPANSAPPSTISRTVAMSSL